MSRSKKSTPPKVSNNKSEPIKAIRKQAIKKVLNVGGGNGGLEVLGVAFKSQPSDYAKLLFNITD